jgi:hypothetical protein
MHAKRSVAGMTVTLLALALSTLAPATADAGSLLSGYGGPGEGNQVILGSALLNTPGGGGGSTGGGSTGASSTTPDIGDAAAASGAPAGSPDRGHAPESAGTDKQVNGGAGKVSDSDARPYATTSELVGSQTLGLSSGDLVDVLLALGALILTGALTGRLARQPG